MFRPTLDDHKVIGVYTGEVVLGVGMLMLVPLVTALVFAEWDTAVDFAIGLMACLAVGFGLQAVCLTERELRRAQGLVVVSASWILATLLGAIPFALSGHIGGFIDALFDVMSGLTTTGLYLIQDLDHVSNGLDMWRFVLTFAGGQGIVVIALTLTALALGQEPVRAVLHGLWTFMGAFSTGGFAPQSFNTVWYHSIVFEMLCIIIFVAGSLNFAVHWAVWTGDRAELRRNIETRSFAVTMVLFVLVAAFGLARAGVYPDAVAFVRKVFYVVASAHTTTGFATIYSRATVTQWGPLAMIGLIGAMVVGASSASTGGGIKGFRVGVITKAFVQDIRRMVSPDSAVVVSRYHHIRDRVLNDVTVRSALAITVAFLTMHALVTVVGVYCGYPVLEAAFEGISAGSNTGLSCGLLTPATPDMLKALYTVAMWLGRLEFMAVFALVGWGWSAVKGR